VLGRFPCERNPCLSAQALVSFSTSVGCDSCWAHPYVPCTWRSTMPDGCHFRAHIVAFVPGDDGKFQVMGEKSHVLTDTSVRNLSN
jgi:hypothetical protein